MAQPTLGTRPATWAGTSGPILYKFTSTNYSNAGYRMEVELWDNVAAAKIADITWYSDSSGNVVGDVSPFLKDNMSLDNEADLTTSDIVYEDVNFINYYIKYQEVWTASSETQVSDSVNDRFAIYGGLQIGSANNMTDYIDPTFDFLMYQSTGLFLKNVPFLFSFKSVNGAKLRVVRKLDGSTLDTTDTNLTSDDQILLGKHKETATADQVVLSVVAPGVTMQALGSWGNQSTGTSWTTGANPSITGLTGVFTYSKYIAGTFAGIAGVSYSFDYDIDVTDASGIVDISSFYLLDSSFNVLASQDISASGGGNFTGTVTLTPTAKSTYIAFRLRTDNSGVGTVDADINSVSHNPASAESTISEIVTINLVEDCNSVFLQWRNSLGGAECFPFQVNQEYTWTYSDRKAKRLTLYANNLTLTQWEAIQGLNTLGDLYRLPITEMTTSLNRTSATIGQSVYVIDSSGNKTGVNVIGNPNTTNTKQKTHSAFVTIEYPELFLQ